MLFIKIQLVGDLKGDAVFSFSKGFALNLLQTMTGMELTNISCGNAACSVTSSLRWSPKSLLGMSTERVCGSIPPTAGWRSACFCKSASRLKICTVRSQKCRTEKIEIHRNLRILVDFFPCKRGILRQSSVWRPDMSCLFIMAMRVGYRPIIICNFHFPPAGVILSTSSGELRVISEWAEQRSRLILSSQAQNPKERWGGVQSPAGDGPRRKVPGQSPTGLQTAFRQTERTHAR